MRCGTHLFSEVSLHVFRHLEVSQQVLVLGHRLLEARLVRDHLAHERRDLLLLPDAHVALARQLALQVLQLLALLVKMAHAVGHEQLLGGFQVVGVVGDIISLRLNHDTD